MGKVVILATGGTIAMTDNGQGAVPALDAQDLTARLPPEVGPVEGEQFDNIPSAHMTLGFLFKLATRVREIVADRQVDGVVITHGTDTMEETAYLLDLMVDTDKPTVLTGAMRNVSQIGYEGTVNLLAAVRVAGSSEAKGLGALLVMNDEIHAARHVTKTHTQNPETFQSPGWGPLGRVEGDRIVIAQRIKRRYIPCDRLAGDVPLIKLAVGMDDGFLRQALERHAEGVVIEALGGGRVPPWWLPAIAEAVKQGIVIVVASRCPVGRAYDQYGYPGAYQDLKRLGVIFSEGLSGPKARIKLMVALGNKTTKEEIESLFLQS